MRKFRHTQTNLSLKAPFALIMAFIMFPFLLKILHMVIVFHRERFLFRKTFFLNPRENLLNQFSQAKKKRIRFINLTYSEQETECRVKVHVQVYCACLGLFTGDVAKLRVRQSSPYTDAEQLSGLELKIPKVSNFALRKLGSSSRTKTDCTGNISCSSR